MEQSNMPGRKRKLAARRESEGDPGYRPIPAELNFAATGDIGKPPIWLDKDARGNTAASPPHSPTSKCSAPQT
jgi:hypothetical protein